MFKLGKPRFFVYNGPAISVKYINIRGTVAQFAPGVVLYTMRGHTSNISLYEDEVAIGLEYGDGDLLLNIFSSAPELTDPHKISFSFTADINLEIELPAHCTFRRDKSPQIRMDSPHKYIAYALDGDYIKLRIELYIGHMELVLAPDNPRAALEKLNSLLPCD